MRESGLPGRTAERTNGSRTPQRTPASGTCRVTIQGTVGEGVCRVSTGGARRGRRDNGLDAADYAAAGDVDPRVGEHLLDVLAGEGIAAYLQPSADLNPVLRATTLPGRPTDRLYVDRAHLADARATLNRLTGGVSPIPPAPRNDDRTDAGGSQRDVDTEWAKIIAGYHTPTEPTADAPWPAAEGADATRAPDQKTDPTRPYPGLPSATDFSGVSLNRRRTDNPAPLDGLDPFGVDAAHDADDDEEDRYIPPPPPPLPRISKYALAALLGIIVGFVLFLRPTLLPIDPALVTLIGFSAVIAGAGTLIWRLRSGDDDDDDFEDGAIV
jgi:hypothetical protein